MRHATTGAQAGGVAQEGDERRELDVLPSREAGQQSILLECDADVSGAPPIALARLERVQRSTRHSKEVTSAIGARNLTDLTQFMPGMLAGISGRLVARTGLMSRLDPIANTVVTNVPGPQIPLYFTSARMVTTFGLGLPLDGIGLFHAIFSYNGTITIAITACRDQLPDPAFYAECLQRSFDELQQAMGSELTS